MDVRKPPGCREELIGAHLVGVAAQIPAGDEAVLGIDRDGTGHVFLADEIDLLLVVFERGGDEVAHRKLRVRRAGDAKTGRTNPDR